MTDAELRLWNELRAHRLMGMGFRRQFPIAGYIVDFACPSRRLIVEVDGSQHAHDVQLEIDERRRRRLEQDGWTVLRFWNDDVLRDIDNVCRHIVIVAGLAGERVGKGKVGGQRPPLSCRTSPHEGGDHTGRRRLGQSEIRESLS